jgi:hypothetical protein
MLVVTVALRRALVVVLTIIVIVGGIGLILVIVAILGWIAFVGAIISSRLSIRDIGECCREIGHTGRHSTHQHLQRSEGERNLGRGLDRGPEGVHCHSMLDHRGNSPDFELRLGQDDGCSHHRSGRVAAGPTW